MKGSESVWVSTQRLQYPGLFIPIGSNGIGNIPTWMVDFYGFSCR